MSTYLWERMSALHIKKRIIQRKISPVMCRVAVMLHRQVMQITHANSKHYFLIIAGHKTKMKNLNSAHVRQSSSFSRVLHGRTCHTLRTLLCVSRSVVQISGRAFFFIFLFILSSWKLSKISTQGWNRKKASCFVLITTNEGNNNKKNNKEKKKLTHRINFAQSKTNNVMSYWLYCLKKQPRIHLSRESQTKP